MAEKTLSPEKAVGEVVCRRRLSVVAEGNGPCLPDHDLLKPQRFGAEEEKLRIRKVTVGIE